MAVGYYKKIIILLFIICSGLFVNACSNDILPSRSEISIKELLSYDESHTPSELHYSYVGEEWESKEVTIYDEDIIEQTLAVILDTKVLKQGYGKAMFSIVSLVYSGYSNVHIWFTRHR